MQGPHFCIAMKSTLKKLYAALPGKRPLFRLLRATFPMPERLYRHLHFKGEFEVPVEGGDAFRMMHHGYLIENELFWRGLQGWERVSLELWRRLALRSGTILDIGANTGVYALLARSVNPKARVVAVEAVERVHRKLVQNIALNGNTIEAIHAAASDHVGTAVLYDRTDREHVLSVSLDPAFNADDKELVPVEVPCTTIDELARLQGGRVDLIKIDVEMHEPEVLRGAREVLRRDRPAMLIEVLSDAIATRVEQELEGLGYLYFNIDDRTWPPARVDHLSRSDHFNFLVCSRETAEAIGLR